MKEKSKSLEVKIGELRQIVESASSLPSKRLKIIYSNTEFRLKDITGIDPRYIGQLEVITSECMDILDKSDMKESYDTYRSKLNLLLDNILSDSLIKLN